MDGPNLGSDESIIKTFPRIIITGKRHEVNLTNQRLILVETETGKVRRETRYQDIVLAVQGINALKEPTITITSISPGGEERQTDELIFVHILGGQNIQACEACMDLLREKGVPSRTGSRLSLEDAAGRGSVATTSLAAGSVTPGRPAVPDFSPFATTYKRAPSPAGESKGSSPARVLAGALIVFVIVIAGFIILGSIFSHNSQPAPGNPDALPGNLPVTPPVPDQAVPAMTFGTTAPVTPAPAPVPRSTQVPDVGIWLRISYPGNYTGNLKAGGWRTVINSTGTTDYNIATQNSLIEGTVEKMDGSGEAMTIGLYNGGSLVFGQTTTKPYGVIDIHQEVGPALGGAVYTPPSAPVAALPTPDPSLVLQGIPENGVWVRVSYAGNVTGSILANSYAKEVNGTGDQFYQLSMTGGAVEGLLAKEDGSTRDLVVQVYKDGTLITAVNTSRPRGVVDLHTVV